MKQKSLKLNFILNSILQMSSFIFPLITFPYISRILLPVGTGKIAFATSVITYFTLFSQLGIPTYGVRSCAKVRDDKEKLSRLAHELMFLNIIMSVLSYMLLAIGLIFVAKFREERTLLIITSMTIILSAIGMEWLYKALEQYAYITIRSIIFKLVALGAMFILIHKQSDYLIYGGIAIFAGSASNIMNFINAHKYIYMKNMGGYNIRQHLKPVMVFFAMSCATTIYTNLDNVMLGFIKDDEAVGYYNAAVKIKNILVSIITSLGAVILPRAAYYIEHGLRDEFDRISAKALNFVMIVASPLALYFILFAKEGIYFISGGGYAGSIIPMQIIMPTILFIGLTNILGMQMLVPLGKEKTVLYSVTVGAVIDVIINAVLIPKYSASGAAIGTLVAEIAVLIFQVVALRKEVASAFKRIHYWKIVVGMLLGVAASLWVKRLALTDFVLLVISAILFFAVYGGFLLLTKETLVYEIINQIFVKIKGKLKKQ